MVAIPPKAIYLVQEQPNPSTDFFVVPALAQIGCDEQTAVIRCGFTERPPIEKLTGAVVIFVRYVPREWTLLVDSARDQLARVIFFMDDDLLQTRASHRPLSC